MPKFVVFVSVCLIVCSFLLSVEPASAALTTIWSEDFIDYNQGDKVGQYSNAANPVIDWTSTSASGWFADKNSRCGVMAGMDTYGSAFWDWELIDISDWDHLPIGIEIYNDHPEGVYCLDNIVFEGSSVPIPTPILLLCSGFVGLVGLRCKNRQ